MTEVKTAIVAILFVALALFFGAVASAGSVEALAEGLKGLVL